MSKLTAIYLGLYEYHEKYGHFPPAIVLNDHGEPAHSWRVLLLEFLAPEVYEQYRFDEKWDSPANSKLSDLMPKCYSSGSDKPSRFTNFVVVQGPDTAFPYDKFTRMDDIKTAPETTILVVEIAHSDIHWMEPRDLTLDSFSPEARLWQTPISTTRTRLQGPLVLMADGQTVVLNKDDVIYPFLIIRGKWN